MTHMPGSPVAFDPPGDWEKCIGHADGSRCTCRKCKGKDVRRRTHESSDGAYEDAEFRCFECGHTWWVDGIDS